VANPVSRPHQINTALGDEQVIATILDTMRRLEVKPDLKPMSLRGMR